MKFGTHAPRRVWSLILAIVMIISLMPVQILAADTDTTVYLVPNSNWTQADARFAMYCFGNGETWVDMSDPDGDGIYEGIVPAGYPNVIFCRMNPSTTNNSWENKWNQTGDLTLPTDGTNCYTVADGTWDNGGGTWSTYTPAVVEPEKETITVYFRNDWLWPEVYVHYWDDPSGQGTSWPGEKMTFVETIDGLDIYSAEIPAWATGIIFNGLEKGNPSNRQQTPNITGFADGDAFYIHWDGENKVSKFEYAPAEPEKETITVYFRNDWLWPEVYVHYWDDPSGQGTSWPGEKMTFVETIDGLDIYSAEIPAWATGILFNGLEKSNPSNRQQTPNITGFADGDAFYIHWDGENKVSKFDYTPTGEEPEVPVVPEETYIIAGTAGLCGTEWDVSNTNNKMSLNSDGLYEKTYESIAAGNHEFKVTDGTWNNSWGKDGGSDNYVFTLDAISNVTITFNAETKAITVTSEATGEEPEPVEPVNNVTIHYRNTGMWGTVNYFFWFENGDADTGTMTWPGEPLSENADHKNWYTLELTDLNAANGIGVIFNNGSSQTGDIMITADGEYWYDGALLTEAPETWADGSLAQVEYTAVLHFANTLGWGGVNLYTWTGTGTTPCGSWPGTPANLDEDGFYTQSVTYEAPEGHGLNFIFNGSGQTVDLFLEASAFDESHRAEKWVVPTTTDPDGKYYADIVDSPDAIAISPVVSDKSVTFAYKDANASSVSVAGTMNGWTPAAMTRNDYGVWSITLNDVEYGLHQYKFIVDDNWVLDPLNSWVYTEENGNQNSAFLISNPEADINTVTIRVHFDAPSAEWNVCAWGAKDLEPQYNFVDNVATITLDGRANQYVAFKIRKSIPGNDWAEQSGEIRVDLGRTVSGTIDIWVNPDFSWSQSLNDDVVYANKIKSVELDYDNNTIVIQTVDPVSNADAAFAIYQDGEPAEILEKVSVSGSACTLELTETLDLVNLYRYKIAFLEDINEEFQGGIHNIGINTVYASDKFAAEFTYDGELGALWSENSTTFRVWAPTAAAVSVNLYQSGSEKTDDLIISVPMTAGEDGTWYAAVGGDQNGVYYTYAVTVNGETVESVDPYARTTGVNGKRGMVIDLDSTDPAGWNTDSNPNPIEKYSDAVIYELHVRDFSIDDSSGVSEANRGKYLAFTEEGTTTANGAVTGIDYLEDLGITHLHLLPVYDYGSVDETKCENFNWGYDPVNYNTPEGSYATDPYNGEVRVKEFKQMVSSLHDAGISVIMDVVYNHVYDAGKFCMNQIVPGYFSRTNADGSYSNGSGCGNDTASEREMVRKYIVESVLYWHEEYHIDGFRFDLVGLLDATTINEIVDTVHACCPDVIFYGEGWTLGTAVEPGNGMATQANSAETPDFAYFSDTIRNLLAGSNGHSLGFVSGQTGQEEAIRDNFMASPWWSKDPQQIVQYASCHDNYTLVDKLILSTGKNDIDDEIIKMNNLAAAIYMTSQGIPFIHAGEEFLREKLEEDGGRCENSYNASDYVNHIEWSNLEKEAYAANSDYYKGLIEFRKAHEALRLETRAQINRYVDYTWVTNEVVMFTIDAKAAGDVSDSIVVIFNANKNARNVTLPEGEWSVCINGKNAGNQALSTVSGSVSVDGISAMVLVQGNTEQPHEHDYQAVVTAPTCTEQGYTTYTCECGDSYVGDYVDALGHNVILMASEPATCELNGYEYYACEHCGGQEYTILLEATGHNYVDGKCEHCGEADPNAKPSKPGWGSWFDKWFGSWWGDEEDDEEAPTTPVEPSEPEEPSVPSEPEDPEEDSKPGWGGWFDKWFGSWWGDNEEDEETPTTPIVPSEPEPSEPEEPSAPSEPEDPEEDSKPGWGGWFDWIFGWF